MGLDGVIDITAKQRQTVLALLARHLPNTTAWVYGSRAKWTSRPQSDLDMVVFATPEQASRVSDLEEAFEESNLPFRVDLFVWDAVPDQFRKKIEREHVVLLAVEEPDIVDQFDVVRLGDVASVRSGYAFKSSDWVDTGIPVVKIQNVKSGSLVMDGCSFVSPQVASDAGEFELQHNDILIAMTGYIGDIAMVRHRDLPAVLNQRVGRFSIRDPNRIDNRFLFYSLRYKGVRKKIENLGYGSAQPNVSPSLVHSVDIPLPPLSEQRAIAHILGTLDDKIELNRRMNETLEAMARALFKSWFVDFDPVRAKMEGRDTGLPQDIAELFPDRLVDSEIGEIPKGWKVGCVSDVCKSIENGGTPKRALREYWNGDVKWFKTSELVDEPLLNSSEHITNLGLRNSSCKLWPAGTVLIALYASPTVGRLGILEVSAAANQACCGLIVEPEFGKLFLFYLLFFGRRYFQNIAVGSAQQNISQQIVRNYQIVIPAAKISREFDSLVEAIYLQRVAKHSESRTLAVLRDILLPKLISGEIRVGDAEMALESVT